MISADMTNYNYFTFGTDNGYGQQQISTEPQGVIKISIYNISTAIGDNIKYKEASFIGLTHDNNVNDSYVIEYGESKLKVLYVIPKGRLKQVFLQEI